MKKILAMVLAIAMTLSVCSVSAFATDTEQSDPVNVTAITVQAADATIGVGETTTVSATVTPDNATNKAVTWSISGSGSISGTTVKGTEAGTITVTATAADGSGATDSATIAVKEITSVSGSIDVAYGTSASAVDSALDAASLTLNYDGGYYNGKLAGTWVAPDGFDAKEPGDYTFTASDIHGSVTVTVKKATLKNSSDAKLETVYVPLGTDEDDLADYLDDEVTLQLNNGDYEDFDIGGSDDYYDWWTCSNYDEDEEGSYTFTADANPSSSKYFNLSDLTVTVVVFDEDFEGEVDYAGGSLSSIADQIDALLYAISDEHAESIEITDMTGYDEDEREEDEDYVGGILYVDSDCTSEVDLDEIYDFEDFEEFYFLPDGSGYTTYIYYSAWNDEDEIDGCIALEAPTFLLLRGEIDNEDTLTFDSDDFVDLIADSAYDDYDLVYIDNVKVSSGGGSLYYEYDEDAKKNTKISSSEEYYVDDEEDDIIDAITYVPGTNTSGTVTITFDAIAKKGSRSSKTLEGIYQINVIERADITITANKNQEVAIDYDLFEEFFEDNVASKYDDYEITYITFSGAPASNAKGWLYADDVKIKKPNSTDFYIDDDDEGDYPFDELYFLGGTSNGTVSGTFEIYGRSSSTASSKKILDGTIDFVTGAATNNTLSGSTTAAKVFSFNDTVTLEAFENLGGNDNEYIVFTSLPVGGKLVYNWGTNNQQDVTIGTAYYLNGYGSQKLLKNVTFVPSYSASKVEKTVTMNIKGYNEKDKAVNGSINIIVKYASSSSKFYDITTSTYADSVDFLANEGITTGMTATTFGPNNNVTRAQFVTFLWRAAGSPAVYGTNKFTDVKTTGEHAYAYNAILWAVQNNITTGRSATKFDPGANVTHQELLTFLYRYDVNYLGHSAAASSYVSYTDYNSVDPYAQVPVKWADYKGIISGYTIQPKVAGTRATVALWLHRMLTL